MTKLKIVWSKQARDSLKDIYDYYKTKSSQGANHVRLDFLNAPKKIIFAQQYQVDEINSKF